MPVGVLVGRRDGKIDPEGDIVGAEGELEGVSVVGYIVGEADGIPVVSDLHTSVS